MQSNNAFFDPSQGGGNLGALQHETNVFLYPLRTLLHFHRKKGGIFFQVAVAMHQGMLSPFPSSSEEEENNFTHASPSLSLSLCRERQRLPFKCRVSDTPPSSSSRENRYPGTHSYFPFFSPPRINRAIREWLFIKGRDPSSLFPPLRAPETEAHKHTRRRRRRREALMWSKVK